MSSTYERQQSLRLKSEQGQAGRLGLHTGQVVEVTIALPPSAQTLVVLVFVFSPSF